MGKRVLLSCGLLGSLAFLLAASVPRADTGNPARKVTSFTLTAPLDQKPVSLADFKDKKAIAVIFVGTQCPINNLFIARLAEMHREYAPKGVQFLAINSNLQDTPESVAAHARKYNVPFPVLKDPGNTVADLFDARRTPEAFVLDATGTIRYQGRINDQYGINIVRPKPTRNDLTIAIDEVLAGKAVSQPTTEVAGCLIAKVKAPKKEGPVTFTKDVARIVQKNCQECHRPGQIGPMPLLTFDDVSAWSETIREVVSERRMPPWTADPRYSKFGNDRRLADQERDAILAWIEQGCPKGDDKDMPPPRQFVEGWQIGEPDLVLSMPVEYDVPADMPKRGVPYKHFEIETNFKEDHWVVRAEAKAGAPDVVHHVLVFVLPAGQKFNPDDPNNSVVVGTVPGDMAVFMPNGTAKRIPAGSKLVFQVHYTPNGKPQKDRSSIGMIFAKEGPIKEVKTVPVLNPFFRIPPGNDNYKVESNFTFAEDGHIIGFMPHMHLRGKDFLYEAIYPDGRKETLLSVPNFNFNWQSVYRLTEAHFMPKGSKVHCVAHYDNSTKNPNNPDPAKTVFWGDQTWEEMMIGWTDYTYDGK